MRVPDADDHVARTPHKKGDRHRNGSRQRRGRCLRERPHDHRNGGDVDDQRAVLHPHGMPPTQAVPRRLEIEEQWTWMVPPEAGVRAHEQPALERLERVDLEDRAV